MNATELKGIVETNLAALEPVLAFVTFEVKVSGTRSGFRIALTVDSVAGIGIDDCASISRALNSALFENERLTEVSYVLEVASPGATEPLRHHWQYPRHIGRTLKVITTDGETIEGELAEATSEAIELLTADKLSKKRNSPKIKVNLPLGKIAKATVVVSLKPKADSAAHKSESINE